MAIDIGGALNFPFQDKDWISKVAITIVLLFIPIFGWGVIGGYMVRVTKNVLTGLEVLPAYDDWGGDFGRGLMMFIGSLIYAAPVIILSLCTSFLFDDSLVIQCCATLVYIAYGLVVLPVQYAAMAHYAMTEDFSVFLDFSGRIEDTRNHISEAVGLWLAVIVVGIVVSIVGTIGLVLCIIPGLIVIGASYMVQAHVVGQWGKIIGVAGGNGSTVTPTGTTV